MSRPSPRKGILSQAVIALSLLSIMLTLTPLSGLAAPKSTPVKPTTPKPVGNSDAPPLNDPPPANKEKPATGASDKKTPAKATTPEPVLENVVSVSPEDLVNKPQDFLGKNVKFTGNFFAWSNLALDYKPAFRSSKTHLSFLILRPSTHIPLPELKLAMMIPKEKDPETQLFATLKDGDQIELVGKVFSSALDDPWIEVFKLKKLSSSAEDKKTASADGNGKNGDSSKAEKSSSDKSAGDKSAGDKSGNSSKPDSKD